MTRWLNAWSCTLTIGCLVLMIGCVSQPSSRPNSYTVKAGDTLYSIAARYGIDYHELARVNGIGADYRIHVGELLRLPSNHSPARTNTIEHFSSEKAPIPSTNIAWHWPTTSDSYVLTTRPNGGRGLLINGVSGQDIRATAAGKVVYTGSGLLGYGQLIIVKHDEVYLSAYAHLQMVLVKEGEQISADQRIATMGNGPAGAPLLYFEIRANGQPVDPLSLLLQQR